MPVFFAYDYRKQDGTERYIITKPLERRLKIDFTPKNHIKGEPSPHTHTRVWDAENKGWRTLILSNIKDIICRNYESTEKFREYLEKLDGPSLFSGYDEEVEGETILLTKSELFEDEDVYVYEFDIEDIKSIRSYYKSKIEEEEFWIYTFGIAMVAMTIVAGGYFKICN